MLVIPKRSVRMKSKASSRTHADELPGDGVVDADVVSPGVPLDDGEVSRVGRPERVSCMVGCSVA